MAKRDTYGHPDYLGLQIDWPLFVHKPFEAGGKHWEKGEYFNWPYNNIEPRRVATLYRSKYVHHDKAKEKENKVGDRLNEMTHDQLLTVYEQLNVIMKRRCSTNEEYKKKRCKGSKIDDKQRGLIRQFLRNTKDIQEDYEQIRDYVLGE